MDPSVYHGWLDALMVVVAVAAGVFVLRLIDGIGRLMLERKDYDQ